MAAARSARMALPLLLLLLAPGETAVGLVLDATAALRHPTLAAQQAPSPLPGNVVRLVFLPELAKLLAASGRDTDTAGGGQPAHPLLRLDVSVGSLSAKAEAQRNTTASIARVCSGAQAELLEEARGHREGAVLVADPDRWVLEVHTATPHGVLLALGRLLREVEFRAGRALLSVPAGGLCMPLLPVGTVRGHQIGFYFEGQTEKFKDYVRELALFGTNQIEFAHWSWGAHSPPPHAPATGMTSLNAGCSGGNEADLAEWSAFLADIGMNMSLWWPMDLYTADDGKRMGALLSKLKRLNSLFVPGGDGGLVLAPGPMFEVVTAMAQLVHTHHPGASIWVSAQEYSAKNLTAFMDLAGSPQGAPLTGLVYGPHVRVPMREFHAMAPGHMPVRQYPDLCHSLDAQYEVNRLDQVWGWTHGREVVNSMPRMFHAIAALRMNASYAAHQYGFGAYSEGLSDDMNKAMFSGLYSDRTLKAENLVGQYARVYFGSDRAAAATELLFALERNWHGPISANHDTISATLATARRLAALPRNSSRRGQSGAGWREAAYVKRAYYDAYVAARVQRELKAVEHAMGALLSAPANGSHAALEAAEALAEDGRAISPATAQLKAEVLRLFAELNATLGTTAVLQCQVPDLGVPRLDARVSDVPYLLTMLGRIGKLPTELDRLAAIEALLNATNPGPGGFYDAPGSVDPAHHPHLDPGQGNASDPSYYYTPLQQGSPPSHVSDDIRPTVWFTYVQAFFDNSVRFAYAGLSPSESYVATVVYFPSDAEVRLTAAQGTVTVHGYLAPSGAQRPMAFPIPPAAYADGRLDLAFNQPPGLAGSGRCCQVSELFISTAGTVLGHHALLRLLAL